MAEKDPFNVEIDIDDIIKEFSEKSVKEKLSGGDKMKDTIPLEDVVLSGQGRTAEDDGDTKRFVPPAASEDTKRFAVPAASEDTKRFAVPAASEDTKRFVPPAASEDTKAFGPTREEHGTKIFSIYTEEEASGDTTRIPRQPKKSTPSSA